ncbi:UNVERIFIED_CONTAM: Anthranilate synthase alpha subunit, chloroplastic [Sesamum radiatum]|uniref:Anthranilate synthase alpha subunit, chloroplastic n=1 Tax=Sesamum radiatum TaxID=300843 RepID=A0AAW2TEA6_SESRA
MQMQALTFSHRPFPTTRSVSSASVSGISGRNWSSSVKFRLRTFRCRALKSPSLGGWVGFFSYDTIRYVEKKKLPFSSAPKDDRNLADIHLGLYDDVIVFDHVDKARGCILVASSPEILTRVKKVTGELLDHLTGWDALRAALPVGTVSGAPKVKAMELIDQLEPTRRGPYSGGFGGVSFLGDMDIALALRTIVFPTGVRYDTMYSYKDGNKRREWGCTSQSGAGIVADSLPEDEQTECERKAAGLARAIDLAESAFVNKASAQPAKVNGSSPPQIPKTELIPQKRIFECFQRWIPRLLRLAELQVNEKLPFMALVEAGVSGKKGTIYRWS